MKVRNVQRHEDVAELQMTPMIDIVFQLLVFFIMTFKIVSPEGDFNIKMPLAAPSEGLPDDNQLPPIKVTLRAASNGKLSAIRMGDRTLGGFGALRAQIREIVGDATGPGSIAESTEVELDCDYHLKFEHVIDAITAVSGYVDDSGHVVKVIEKIKFSPPKKPT
jgi:biopolymer transport protein ExbD